MRNRIFASAIVVILFSALIAHLLRAQVVGDDLSAALANHGMDTATAPLAAAAIEIIIANNNAFLARVAADEANIKQLQAAVAKLTPLPAASGPIQVAADLAVSSSGVINAATTSDVGTLDGKKIVLVAGQSYTYNLTIPTAGNYTPFARLTSTIGTVSVHFELTAGVNASGPVTNTTAVWVTESAAQSISLPAGVVSLHMVVDSVAGAGMSFADIVGAQ